MNEISAVKYWRIDIFCLQIIKPNFRISISNRYQMDGMWQKHPRTLKRDTLISDTEFRVISITSYDLFCVHTVVFYKKASQICYFRNYDLSSLHDAT